MTRGVTVVEQIEREISNRIGAAAPDWQAQFGAHGKDAPGHAMVSQIVAIVGDHPDSIVHVEAQVGPVLQLGKLELSLVVFTADLILKVTREAGETPTTEIIPRRSLMSARLVSAPIVTFQQSGSDWIPTIVELSYPTMELRLPFDESRRDASDAVASLLPSLMVDLASLR